MSTMPEHAWITDAAGLTRLAAALRTAPWVALDTESNSMFVYRERLCLLQVNAGGSLFVVDTLALPGAGPGPTQSLAALKAELERADRPLWLHGGEYDVAVMRRDHGIALGGVWDSQQAASMLGWERTGYGAVVEKLCGVALDKAWTHYDWATRPLDPGALRYALDDVVYLPRVCEQLVAAVREAGLEEEVAIANRAVADAGWSGGFDPAGFWKLKGVRELKPHQLGILAGLWTWRDERAKERDVPPGRLINNEAMLAVARAAPTNYQLLKKVGLRGVVLGELGEALIACIKAAQTDPPPLPARPRHREVGPDESARETKLKDWRRGEAERRHVPLQVVLPAKALEHLKQHGAAGDLAQVPQLGAKRAAMYGETLRRLCS